jgi:hypothetical protein
MLKYHLLIFVHKNTTFAKYIGNLPLCHFFNNAYFPVEYGVYLHVIAHRKAHEKGEHSDMFKFFLSLEINVWDPHLTQKIQN